MMTKINGFPILETKRLILRQVMEEDASNLLVYLSDADVMKYYGLEPFKSIHDAFNEISWYQSIFEKGTGIRWGISLKEQDKIIGSCGFFNRVAQHYRAELGFELSKAHWGTGIASEAVQAIIRYGLEQMDLQRIEALIEPPNLPSQKVVERQGFIKEGRLRNYEYTGGKFIDLDMYSLLKQDYQEG